ERNPRLGALGRPGMAAASEVQHPPEAGPWLAPAPMAAAGAPPGHQPRRLQSFLHEGVAEAHAVLPPGELVKVADVEPLVTLAIEPQDAVHLGHRRPLW